MDINIRLSIDAPRGWKRRVLLYVGTPLGLIAATVAVTHAGVGAPDIVTTWIQPNQAIPASSLSGNLVSLQSQINTLASMGAATFCGPTSLSTNGNIGGYAKAKKACEAVPACGPSSHMCSGDELVRSAQLGTQPNVDGWYSVGASFYGGAANPNVSNDCAGWTSANGGDLGPNWLDQGAGIPDPGTEPCNIPLAILCCK